jgi:5-methylthioadenosine/S-adenosylhomocysteine deaminase
MRTGAILGKVSLQDPTVLPPWEMLKLATIGGARVLAIGDEVGSLREGKRADIITIDKMAPTLLPTLTQPFATIIPNLVYSSTGYEVLDVIIEGEQILMDGAFVDEVSGIYRQANEQAQRILDEAGQDWNEANSMMVRYHQLGYL